jgi:hypothetical protein
MLPGPHLLWVLSNDDPVRSAVKSNMWTPGSSGSRMSARGRTPRSGLVASAHLKEVQAKIEDLRAMERVPRSLTSAWPGVARALGLVEELAQRL